MLTRKILVVVMILNIIFVSFVSEPNVVSAKEIDSAGVLQNENSGQCSVGGAKNIDQLDSDITAELLEIAQESDMYKSFEEKLRENNFTDAFSKENELRLITEDSYAYQLDKLSVLYIPISGGTGDSYYGIQFDPSLAIFGSVAGIFTPSTENNITVHYQINGQTVADLIVTEKGDVLEGHLYDLDGRELDLQEQTKSMGSWWNCMNGCLSSMGVPAYLIGVLGIVCGIACAASAGTACLGCLVIALGASSFIGIYCAGACA